jgi:hypothetical protein
MYGGKPLEQIQAETNAWLRDCRNIVYKGGKLPPSMQAEFFRFEFSRKGVHSIKAYPVGEMVFAEWWYKSTYYAVCDKDHSLNGWQAVLNGMRKYNRELVTWAY